MTLLEAVQFYVERKRSEGLEYDKPALNLVALSRHVGDMPLGHITTRQVLTFLDGPKTSPITWEKKFNLVRGFFNFWLARGEIQTVPMPVKRKPGPQTFVPYIYSRTEIRTLLKAIRPGQKQDACKIDSQTLRTFLLFLYGTGALIGEARRLLMDDVDLNKSMITIRSNRFNRSRKIPIGPDMNAILRRYLVSRRKKEIKSPRFFLNKNGEELNVVTLAKTFERVRRVSGIARHDGACYQPRMHDLRHTFAVHRVTAWMRHGADLNRMLPALAAYIGQVGLASTERYLSLTPNASAPSSLS